MGSKMAFQTIERNAFSHRLCHIISLFWFHFALTLLGYRLGSYQSRLNRLWEFRLSLFVLWDNAIIA